MNTAQHYAKGLVELIEADPQKGSIYLTQLRQILLRRGHEKLLPRIFSEYQKLVLAGVRTKKYSEVTPQMQRTDTLLQLYKRLIATK